MHAGQVQVAAHHDWMVWERPVHVGDVERLAEVRTGVPQRRPPGPRSSTVSYEGGSCHGPPDSRVTWHLAHLWSKVIRFIAASGPDLSTSESCGKMSTIPPSRFRIRTGMVEMPPNSFAALVHRVTLNVTSHASVLSSTSGASAASTAMGYLYETTARPSCAARFSSTNGPVRFWKRIIMLSSGGATGASAPPAAQADPTASTTAREQRDAVAIRLRSFRSTSCARTALSASTKVGRLTQCLLLDAPGFPAAAAAESYGGDAL